MSAKSFIRSRLSRVCIYRVV